MEYETFITIVDPETDESKEVKAFINFTVSKYYPAKNYLPNGDPGCPAEGGELEITKIMDENGKEYNEDILSDSVIDDLYDEWDDYRDSPEEDYPERDYED